MCSALTLMGLSVQHDLTSKKKEDRMEPRPHQPVHPLPVCESFIKVSQSQPDVLGRGRSRSVGPKEESLFLGLERRGTLVRRASPLAAAAALDGGREEEDGE